MALVLERGGNNNRGKDLKKTFLLGLGGPVCLKGALEVWWWGWGRS